MVSSGHCYFSQVPSTCVQTVMQCLVSVPPDSVSVALCRYQKEAAAQKEILQGFERDMDQLAALQLHPDIQTDRHNYLIDLIPEQKLREWAARCKRDHDHFAKKVQSIVWDRWARSGRGWPSPDPLFFFISEFLLRGLETAHVGGAMPAQT